MEQVTFIIEHKKDKNLLIAIAEKLGIKKYAVSKAKEKIKNDKREDLLKIIDAGTDVSNFGDPSSWQRETRKDRTFDQSPK
ncbi:MAG: hypothetical protein ABIR31_01120 [Ginsengibacter sp.]